MKALQLVEPTVLAITDIEVPQTNSASPEEVGEGVLVFRDFGSSLG